MDITEAGADGEVGRKWQRTAPTMIDTACANPRMMLSAYLIVTATSKPPRTLRATTLHTSGVKPCNQPDEARAGSSSASTVAVAMAPHWVLGAKVVDKGGYDARSLRRVHRGLDFSRGRIGLFGLESLVTRKGAPPPARVRSTRAPERHPCVVRG
eukprot:scaffold14553_cov120-Isochrysis_galbana.AAC.2